MNQGGDIMIIKEGMYVRFDDGNIVKANRVSVQNNPLFDININGKLYISTSIVKASFKKIDLIQVGDYVNGYKVIGKDHKGILLIASLLLEEDDIKTIVTKERFNEYEF
jgi:hypothetical protein